MSIARKSLLINSTLFISSFLLFLFLIEKAFSLLGIASQPSPLAPYPPYYSGICKNVEFTYHTKANSQGIRYREISFNSRPNEFRTVVLGDSFTVGVVEAEQTYPAVLEKMFSNPSKEINFINCGWGGRGPVEYARVLYHIGFKYNPHQVLIMIYANDLGDVPLISNLDLENGNGWLFPESLKTFQLFPRISELSSRVFKKRASTDYKTIFLQEAKRRGLQESYIEEWTKKCPPNLTEAANKEEFNAALLAIPLLDPNYWIDNLDIATPLAQAKWGIMIQILNKMITWCKERQIPVGIIYAPAAEQCNDRIGIVEQLGGHVKKEWLSRETELERRLKFWCEKNSINYLNLTPPFKEANKKLPDLLYFPIDGHWTPQGNEVAAKFIKEWLQKNNMIL